MGCKDTHFFLYTDIVLSINDIFAPLLRFRRSVVAGLPRAVLFFDCSSFLLRLYSVFKTKNNRRTIGDKTANNTARSEVAPRARWSGTRPIHTEGPLRRDFAKKNPSGMEKNRIFAMDESRGMIVLGQA